jgi:ketosteroid isomerase-like protein
MSQDHVGVARQVYESFARGDVPAVLAQFDPQIEWREAEGFVYADGNPYRGHDEVVKGVFGRLVSDWDIVIQPQEFLPTPDGVVTLGRYTGRHKATGRAVDAPFVHVWRVADGKMRAFQQFTDTAQFKEAVAT